MKNKKVYIIITVIILILVASIGIICFMKLKNKNINSENEVESNIIYNKETNIKSTQENPIKYEEIEATNIDVKYISGTLEIDTTLKNNSNDDIDGFFITIALLDEKGNTVTSISDNSNEKIGANKEISIKNYVVEEENIDVICNAKIVSFEKNSVKDILDDSIDEIEGPLK